MKLSRMVAVPPLRDKPNNQCIEFVLSGYANLAAGGASFLQLTDPQTGNPFAAKVPTIYKGRIDSMLIYCPDLVSAAAPYLFAQLTLRGQLAPAWGFVPVYPRNGVASLSFATEIDLLPNDPIGLYAKNIDAANTHFVAVYLHGWYWNKDVVES